MRALYMLVLVLTGQSEPEVLLSVLVSHPSLETFADMVSVYFLLTIAGDYFINVNTYYA